MAGDSPGVYGSSWISRGHCSQPTNYPAAVGFAATVDVSRRAASAPAVADDGGGHEPNAPGLEAFNTTPTKRKPNGCTPGKAMNDAPNP